VVSPRSCSISEAVSLEEPQKLFIGNQTVMDDRAGGLL